MSNIIIGFMIFLSGIASISGCVAPPVASIPTEPKTFAFPGYSLSIIRSECNIVAATIDSAGPAINAVTFHRLLITASGQTSGLFDINCQPVIAGGRGQCLVRDGGMMTPPSTTAGNACRGWNDFQIRQTL